jgi:type I restriction enzyme R subunit
MSALTLRLPDDKHSRLKTLARQHGTSVNRLMEEMATLMLAEFDAESLIDDFSHPDKAPHIAISVDMLDTGIDIPEIVNLVFFKPVYSKTKFWQMVGRGTRLRPDLFGPGRDKEFFHVFDYCQNLELFSQSPETTEGAGGDSLGKRLFTSRLELIADLDQLLATKAQESTAWNESGLRDALAETLRGEVAAMNVNNFVVRPRRRLVEQYAGAKAWKSLGPERYAALASAVAGLPSELQDNDEDAKRFEIPTPGLSLPRCGESSSIDHAAPRRATSVTSGNHTSRPPGHIPQIRMN